MKTNYKNLKKAEYIYFLSKLHELFPDNPIVKEQQEKIKEINDAVCSCDERSVPMWTKEESWCGNCNGLVKRKFFWEY